MEHLIPTDCPSSRVAVRGPFLVFIEKFWGPPKILHGKKEIENFVKFETRFLTIVRCFHTVIFFDFRCTHASNSWFWCTEKSGEESLQRAVRAPC